MQNHPPKITKNKMIKLMKNILTVLLVLFLAASCHTEYWTPEFENEEKFHDLVIPNEGKTYDIPFVFSLSLHPTRTSVPTKTYQIRGRFLFDGIPGEIYDTARENPIYWYRWRDEQSEPNMRKAIMYAHIPVNESSIARSVAVQISIDSIANDDYSISEDDEHNWGEWTTILDGIQAGR